MNKIIKNIIILLIVIFAAAQSLFMYKSTELINLKSLAVQSNIPSKKDLADFYEELSSLKEKNIVAANEIGGKWYIKLKIEGNKEHLLEELSKLQIYNISEYSINHSNDKDTIIVEISDKDNA